MNRVIFQCEDSMEGILTGVYDAWASRVGHDRVKLEAGPDHEMELFSEYRRVETDGEKAEKVAGTIRRRMGQNCWESIYQATLAEGEGKSGGSLPERGAGAFPGPEEKRQRLPPDGKYPGTLYFSGYDLIQDSSQGGSSLSWIYKVSGDERETSLFGDCSLSDRFCR